MFKRARTEDQIAKRQLEIIEAAKQLYLDGDVDNVTFSKISELTDFTRPAIYKYYQSKEEVLLDLLGIEFQRFNQEIEEQFKQLQDPEKEEFARILSTAMCSYGLMLKLHSIHHTSLENNASLEKIKSFKVELMKTFEVLEFYLKKFFNYTDKESFLFAYSLMLLFSSLYPLTHFSEKQLVATKSAAPDFYVLDFEELCYHNVLNLLGTSRTLQNSPKMR